ncbi:MAG: DeoR/GlpR family DNA-binding transcription regulator [Cypionkella sp.]|uniref:DeoR/GlpR family DNA-binding transcription regulator n=1 Tax=Cypionkella sp. TaxID=2811411 RepID=UPI002AB9053A|nr:DeoR/GlpR family DNA-binding transcription regulator [Cypionkella sp.]MDZ4309591.1 DeoR/GlpR family DNA-binding transcription regulator [Cypionkella sp.]
MKIDRATAIRQHLFAKGYSSIAQIAAAVGASEPTVRRDLLTLEAEGQILRTHGGAQIAGTSGVEVAFESREQINLPAKRAIGEAAYQMLRPETSVFLDAGTTVLQLARRLRLNPLPLRVFTNCLPVAQVLMPVAEIGVTLLGGSLRRQNASMVGPLAEAALERLWFDQLFLGAGGISALGEISSRDEAEARLNTLMLARTKAPVIVADADKFGAQLTYGVAHLGAGMRVLTDARLGAGWQGTLEGLGCAVSLAEGA